jgi:hypothetical protein
MTDSDLRDLFRSAALDDVQPDPGSVARAWHDGTRRRTSARIALLGAVAAATAVVATVVVVGRPGGDVEPAPAPPTPPSSGPTPSPTERPSNGSGPDTTYFGAPVWVESTPADPSTLPELAGTGLPPEIDLSPGAPSSDAVDRAVGVVGMVGEDAGLARVVVVGEDGGSYDLDVAGRLDEVADEGGNVMSALSLEGLAPSGARVFFRQESSLVVHDFGTGRWTTIPTPQWSAETARWVDGAIFVPDVPWGSVGTLWSASGVRVGRHELPAEASMEGGEAYGPQREAASGDVAYSSFLGFDEFSGTNAVVVSIEGRPRALVHDQDSPGGKMCCPVAGWAGRTEVVFQTDSWLLAWEVPDGGLRRVSEITGLEPGAVGFVASWALP